MATVMTSGKQQQGRTVIESLEASAASLQLTLDGNLQRKRGVEADAHIRLKFGNISALGRYDGKPLPDIGLTLQAAVVFDLHNGVAQTEPALAFTTNKITVISKGAVDLKTEKLNFGFKATPNNALKVSTGELLNSFVVVGGTLGKPEVGLDPARVLLQGGAAIGTAGISLLAKGLLDRVGNSTVPLCQSILAEMTSQN